MFINSYLFFPRNGQFKRHFPPSFVGKSVATRSRYSCFRNRDSVMWAFTWLESMTSCSLPWRRLPGHSIHCIALYNRYSGDCIVSIIFAKTMAHNIHWIYILWLIMNMYWIVLNTVLHFTIYMEIVIIVEKYKHAGMIYDLMLTYTGKRVSPWNVFMLSNVSTNAQFKKYVNNRNSET